MAVPCHCRSADVHGPSISPAFLVIAPSPFPFVSDEVAWPFSLRATTARRPRCPPRPRLPHHLIAKDDGINVDFVSSSIWTAFRENRNLSLKSLLGRRSLWRRILFASKKVRSIILLNVITIIYASNIPVLKEVEAIMDPAAFTVVRFVISAIPFIPFVAQAWDDTDTRNAGIELGFWVSLGYLMQALSLLTSDAGRASFISMFTVGDLLSFLSAVFFGVHMLRTEHISRSTNEKNFLPLLGYEVCVVALLSTLWYFLERWFEGSLEINPSSWTWKIFWDFIFEFPWIPALYTGIFSTGLCLWVEMVVMRDVSATETAIICGLEPVWGAGFAWFLLGERWCPTGWLGAILVLAGSLAVEIFGSPLSGKSGEDEDIGTKANNNRTVSELQSRFSFSPVVIGSKKSARNKLTRK